MAHWLPVPTLLLSVTLGTNVNDTVNRVRCLVTSSDVGGAGTVVMLGAMFLGLSGLMPRFLALGNSFSMQAQMIVSCRLTMYS